MYTFEKFYHVVEIGDIDSAKIICNAQPDLIKGKDKYGFSILHGAVMDDKEELINFLIEKGAEVNAKNDEGITPLHIVLYPEIAEILIKKGALVNCISDNGNTPLHSMAENGDESLDEVKILLKNGADKTLKNKSGETAYDIAKGREDKEMMKLLKP
ncbi:MAG: ankyrin repeat domain-containing protein [Bacteroidia bacterium]|nr:ankyrin repeat domain-containing protein [Bacteroidia bacterium]